MSRLPAGWENRRIGDVCTPNNGRAFKPIEWSSKGLPIVRIQNLNNPAASFNYFDGDFDQKYYLKGGELLFAWSGTPGTSFGAHVWRNQEAVLNQHIFRVDFNPNFLDKRFFKHAINQTLDHLIDIAHGGVGLRHVTKGKFESTSIAIPPVAEQKRIADKLDSVLARVDACRDRLDRLPALLKRFRQSILAAATSGRLTDDWRETLSTEKAWVETSIGGISEAIFDGPFGSNLKSDDYTADGVRVVRLENIGHLFFELSKKTYVSDEKYQTLLKHTLIANDLLFSSFVDEEVRVCLLPGNLTTAAINKADCFCIRADDSKCLPVYLAYRLACKTTYLELKALVHGATRPRINLKQLKQYSISLPSFSEQTEIVRRIDILFAFADRLEARLVTARKQVGQLTPALLAKAFRGELVPQDPADEPAAELLKRLAAQREAAPKAKRGRAKA